MAHTDSLEVNVNVGSLAIDTEGVKVGMVAGTYMTEGSHGPYWLVLGTGLFGRREHLVPERGCYWDGKYVQLPYSREVIEGSPCVRGDGPLTPDLLGAVLAYYERP